MMRRLFILTLSVAAVGTAFGSSKSSKTTAGSDWTVAHAKIAQKIYEATRAVLSKNPAGPRVASQDVDAVLKLTTNIGGLDLNATNKDGNTLGDFADALAANTTKRGGKEASDLSSRIKTIQSRLGSGHKSLSADEDQEQPGAISAEEAAERAELARMGGIEWEPGERPAMDPELAELNRMAAAHGVNPMR